MMPLTLNETTFAERLKKIGYGIGEGLGTGRSNDLDLREELAAAAKGDDGSDATNALRLAIERYQRFYADDIDPIARKLHGRKLLADGLLGPATIQHLMNRRCDTPDFASDGTIIEEANWPGSCRHSIKIWFDWSTWNESQQGFSVATAKAEYAKALREWNLVCDLTLELVEDRSEARVVVRCEPLAGSTLAWSHLANNDCGGKEQRFDIRRWTLHVFFLTVLHEVGHLIGLPHTAGNFVMNPSIIESLPGLTASDKSRAIALGYGPSKLDPDEPEDPDDPDVPPGEGGIVKISGLLKNGTAFVSADVKAIEATIRLGSKARATFRFDN
jgi:hypothetical protein